MGDDVEIQIEAPRKTFNPLNAELNPICHLLALLEAQPILHISRIGVNAEILWEYFYFLSFTVTVWARMTLFRIPPCIKPPSPNVLSSILST
jgi:hypothetical protein